MAANFPLKAKRGKVSRLRFVCHISRSASECWKRAKPEIRDRKSEVSDWPQHSHLGCLFRRASCPQIVQAGSMHDRTGKDACATPLLTAAKDAFQPIFELAKEKLQVSAGRFLEEFDDARAQVLLRFINRAGQMHGRPDIAAPFTIENFFGVRQPI